jgi:hypothetical protein
LIATFTLNFQSQFHWLPVIGANDEIGFSYLAGTTGRSRQRSQNQSVSAIRELCPRNFILLAVQRVVPRLIGNR